VPLLFEAKAKSLAIVQQQGGLYVQELQRKGGFGSVPWEWDLLDRIAGRY
jgi:hypothetical protein